MNLHFQNSSDRRVLLSPHQPVDVRGHDDVTPICSIGGGGGRRVLRGGRARWTSGGQQRRRGRQGGRLPPRQQHVSYHMFMLVMRSLQMTMYQTRVHL